MAKSLVVKFGGSCLSTPQNINLAAKKVAEEVKKGSKVVVVVSALAGVTDNLLKTATEASLSKLSKDELDEILSMGERTATRLMVSALKSYGLKAVGLDPADKLWPIYTNSEYGNAEVDLEKTLKAIKRKVKPLLDKGFVVVVPGFIGLSPEGKTTTLGRGGSDITAVVLGRCVEAEEVVLVKDVAGVLSADPKKVSTPSKIDVLDAEEMFSLSSAGAKILHPRALRYAANNLTLRVVGFNESLSEGTVIKGELGVGLRVSLYPNPVSMVTIVGREVSTPESLLKIFSQTLPSKTKILGLTLASPSLLLYVEDSSKLIENIHNLIKTQKVAKAIHSFEPLTLIVVSGHELEKTPGIVDCISAPLARENINLYGLLTISNSVRVFVHQRDGEKALKLIKESLGKTGFVLEE
ncbi:MAG: hypothetical protein DRO36_02335 [Candidatus Hecatellales archaeon]|nr:MAG: hypothetical protein DRO36_02335 [Candidatus Hecatellales archaeon]